MAAELPYADNPGATHYDGCWRDRGHHNCAVAEVERLRRNDPGMPLGDIADTITDLRRASGELTEQLTQCVMDLTAALAEKDAEIARLRGVIGATK